MSEREVQWDNSVNFWDHSKWQSQQERPGWTLKSISVPPYYRAFLKPCHLLDSSPNPQDSEQPSRSQVFRFTFYFIGLETTHPFCRSLQSLLRTLGWLSHLPCSRLQKKQWRSSQFGPQRPWQLWFLLSVNPIPPKEQPRVSLSVDDSRAEWSLSPQAHGCLDS